MGTKFLPSNIAAKSATKDNQLGSPTDEFLFEKCYDGFQKNQPAGAVPTPINLSSPKTYLPYK
jgi:hypothetical protein